MRGTERPHSNIYWTKFTWEFSVHPLFFWSNPRRFPHRLMPTTTESDTCQAGCKGYRLTLKCHFTRHKNATTSHLKNWLCHTEMFLYSSASFISTDGAQRFSSIVSFQSRPQKCINCAVLYAPLIFPIAIVLQAWALLIFIWKDTAFKLKESIIIVYVFPKKHRRHIQKDSSWRSYGLRFNIWLQSWRPLWSVLEAMGTLAMNGHSASHLVNFLV